MFKILLIVIFFSFSLASVSKANFDVKARTAILQDYHSGEILYEKEPDISIYPASRQK
jgi:D-alanyl-D-alanine carboxypeptidase